MHNSAYITFAPRVMGFSKTNCGKIGPQIFPLGANVSIFSFSRPRKKTKIADSLIDNENLLGLQCPYIACSKNSVLQEAVELLLDGSFVFSGACFFPQEFGAGRVQLATRSADIEQRQCGKASDVMKALEGRELRGTSLARDGVEKG